VWERNPIDAFERLRDRACDALDVVIEIHQAALQAPDAELLDNVLSQLHEPLLCAVAEAQGYWFDTPTARFLDRPEGPVYLDDHEREPGRAPIPSGSCFHDLAIGVAVGLLQSINAGLSAADYCAMMRLNTAGGEAVGQRLANLKSSVRCECQQGIGRWSSSSAAIAATEFRNQARHAGNNRPPIVTDAISGLGRLPRQQAPTPMSPAAGADMSSHRASPFTIAEPAFEFKDREPLPTRPLTVGLLIRNLVAFAEFYEAASANIENAEPVIKAWHHAGRDANANELRRQFRSAAGIERVRAYVLATFGEDLTVATARRLLGELIRKCKLTVEAAEALELTAAMDKLEAKDSAPTADRTAVPPATADAAGAEMATSRPTRSTARGDARVKIIAALTRHHQYADGGCLNTEPIGVNDLARQAEVSRSTVSDFFEKEFEGHAAYKVVCRDAGRLVDSLKALRGEFSPHDLYGVRPPGEGGGDDSD
jgi:hypothetical protein